MCARGPPRPPPPLFCGVCRVVGQFSTAGSRARVVVTQLWVWTWVCGAVIAALNTTIECVSMNAIPSLDAEPSSHPIARGPSYMSCRLVLCAPHSMSLTSNSLDALNHQHRPHAVPHRARLSFFLASTQHYSDGLCEIDPTCTRVLLLTQMCSCFLTFFIHCSFLGGILSGLFTTPARFCTGYEWENYWFVYSIFGLVVVPWGFALLSTDAVYVLEHTPLIDFVHVRRPSTLSRMHLHVCTHPPNPVRIHASTFSHT